MALEVRAELLERRKGAKMVVSNIKGKLIINRSFYLISHSNLSGNLTKNGWHIDIGLQSGDHFAGTCGIHQRFAHFWHPWDTMDHSVQVFLSSIQKWLRYRPTKLCSFCWYMRYTPIFCPFSKSLRYNGPPCARFLVPTKNGWLMLLVKISAL